MASTTPRSPRPEHASSARRRANPDKPTCRGPDRDFCGNHGRYSIRSMLLGRPARHKSSGDTGAMNFDPRARLPLITGDLPGIGGTIKQQPEDFEVEEIPAYEPSGSGDHV